MLTNLAILKVPTRPNPYSTMADYTSWDSLTDRTFSGRHLPATAAVNPRLPKVEDLAELYERERFVESPKSTVLFSYFAQWFTDGFLRSERAKPGSTRDLRRNESNHEIDLTNLYGLRSDVTRQLRALEGGLLKSQQINGEEYPPYLCEDGVPKPEFSLIEVLRFDEQSAEKRNRLFAMGSDTSNLQVGFVMHNVLFLREHNRIARQLAAAYPRWDDDQLFATARNVLTVLLIKVVIEDYINHITPFLFKLRLEPGSFPNPKWYRQNWMAVEFQLLYRWHSLVPPTYRIRGQDVAIWDTLFETELVTSNGLGAMFEDASAQAAGAVGLRNTPPELWHVEAASIQQGREVRLRSYNDYRELAGFPRVTAFDQITADAKVREGLRRLYGSVDEHRVLRRPVRRGAAHELRAAGADRPHGRAGRVLAGVHEPAAVLADLQPADVLAAGHGDHPHDDLARRHRAAQRARELGGIRRSDPAGLDPSLKADGHLSADTS